MSKMKDLNRRAKSYEDRWERSMEGGNVGEVHAASYDYKKNIEAQEKELKNMDPNSKEYERAETSIDEQKSKLWEMEYNQRRAFSDQTLKDEIDKRATQNEKIEQDMAKAVEKGDTRTYDALRSQHEKNIGMQEEMGKRLKWDGVPHEDTVQQQRVAKQNLDIDMRNKMSEKVSKLEEKGKTVKAEDREALEKYKQNVKDDEIENVKKQNEQKIEGMRARGASEKEIEAQKQENERSEKWVESINR